MIIIKRNNRLFNLTESEFARWASLIEAVTLITTMAEKKNIPSDNLLRHLELNSYITERFPSILHDTTQEKLLGNI